MRIRGLPLEAVARLLVSKPPAIDSREPLRVFFCIADHFEPKWRGAAPSLQHERVERWRAGLPRLAEGLADSAGRPPQHTFFYPQDQYEPAHCEVIAELSRAGYGDVEVHIHHDRDTAQSLAEKLLAFTETLHTRHGMLTRRDDGLYSYGFIHGDWSLDNSHPRGLCCGVNNELDVLRETGCYADFTLPAAPNPAQTATINSIYYALDDPEKPKSHDYGSPAAVGQAPPEGQLLLVQGPLAINWDEAFAPMVPRLDYGHLQGKRVATLERLDRWIDAAVTVAGRPNWRFVKLHTHGCEERNEHALLGEPMRRFHFEVARRAAEDPGFKFYYVTAREIASLVHQAERGHLAPKFPVEDPHVEARLTRVALGAEAAATAPSAGSQAAQGPPTLPPEKPARTESGRTRG